MVNINWVIKNEAIKPMETCEGTWVTIRKLNQQQKVEGETNIGTRNMSTN